MRLIYVELSRDEAGDPKLMDVVDRFCMGLSLAGAAVVKSIGPDAPDVGKPPLINLGDAPEVAPPMPDLAKVFGAPATAAVAQPPTAPVVHFSPPTVTTPPAPSPAATVVAPPAPATPTNPVGGVELDVEHLPWDGRIHSANKTKTKEGVWRIKKGINDPGLVAKVQAEGRAALGAQPQAVVTPPATLAPVVAQQQFDAIQQAAAAAVVAPPVAPPPVMPPVAPPAPIAPPIAPAGPTFASFMSRLTPHVTAGLVTEARIGALLEKVGLTGGLPALMQRPDLVAQLDQALDQWVAYWQAGGQ